MQHWKYICFDLDFGAVFLFPPHLTHADVASAFRPMVPLSAGFVRFDTERRELVCYGRSESLKLGPDPHDNRRIASLLTGL